ncbi:PREDICTED: uncharacterized protein LOC105557411 [Vollenhovia emeryi]|uniref:uncharacterized protein LOC105557411 n=1 Tax=Vollenhovia emeryi TaxID=411798 RepID=UPI0005F4F027|nr:PREDICTED: uncharacterized protein LOC105557411 [Vollenhovia emeryi]
MLSGILHIYYIPFSTFNCIFQTVLAIGVTCRMFLEAVIHHPFLKVVHHPFLDMKLFRARNSMMRKYPKIIVHLFILFLIYMYLFYFMYSFSSDKPRYTPRIMSRRFALTSTAYKYLDVGICVVPDESYVEFMLGDNQGNKIVLDYSMWMEIIKKRVEIEQLFKSTDASSVQIDNLVLELVRTYNNKVVILTLDDTCMYMNMSTVLFLLKLEHCVEHVYRELSEDIEAVNESFDQFVCCLQSNMTSAERDDAIGILYERYMIKLLS